MGRSAARSQTLPLLAASGACILVAVGFTRGIWWSNIHNGVLGVTLSLVGAWLAAERPRSREGSLFLAAGLIEAVIFAGRQIGHTATGTVASWLGWLGVWPIVVAMLVTTIAVIRFPDGQLPSRRWRPAVAVAVVLAALCATLSALWPVEWASAGLTVAPPFSLPGRSTAEAIWDVLAHPLYLILQLSWVVAIAVRWRAGRSRAPLLGLLLGVGATFLVLAVGVIASGSATPGLIMVSLVPLVAGWSALHGHVLTRYRALSWLTEADQGHAELPTALARTAAEALDAPSTTVWMGDEATLHAVGVWPHTDLDPPPTPLDALPERAWTLRSSSGDVVGALVVPGVPHLTRSEERMMQDLSAQAALLLDRLTLAQVVQGESAAGHLQHLTPREREVLELMSRGLSNAAICRELHLSVKTVEPLVSAVFAKLGLHADPTVNRRVLAALEYHRG